MKPYWNRQVRSAVFFLACGVLFIGTSCDSDSEKETRTPKTAEYDDIARGIAPLISAQLKANGILETSTNIVLGDGPTDLHVDSTGNLEGSILRSMLTPSGFSTDCKAQ
ncbi:MAG: hypothetical protein MUC50_23040 [Myxococcota bacterium]|nr:hypothetical protein [Myxococcota bacterium]